jgi:ABC-type branched-subunit amino acid transport system ATPase component/ABC-type branched-subunit amino acid transport system permease subunit
MTRTMRNALLAVIVLGFGLVPVLLGDFTVTLLNYIGIYVLVTLGLVLLTGSGGLVSFGQAAFVGLAAYATAWLTSTMGVSPWIGLLAALALTALVGLMLGFITLHLSGHYLPLATICWGLTIFFMFGNFEFLGRHGGIRGIPAIEVFGYSLDGMGKVYYLIWGIVGLSLLAAANLLDSRQGRAIRALRGGKVMAESLGINSFRIRLSVFIIAALLAGLSGWLYAHMQRFVSPSPFELRSGIEYLLMAVLGGAGSITGAVVGAMVIGLLKNWLQDILPLITTNAGNFEIVVFGALFILLLHHARGGLVPYFARFIPKTPPPPIPPTKAKDALPVRPMPDRNAMVLRVSGLTKRFGGLVAVNDVSFEVKAGEIVAMIGPNGAGKSTSFNLITGVLPPSAGRVEFAGRDVTGMTPRDVAAQGAARTFQHVKLRPNMTLLDNVMLGAYLRSKAGFLAGALRLDRAEEAAVKAEAMHQLERVGLADRPYELAGNLALGQQRVLEVARTLAADPTLIMLDEPAAGLRRMEKQALATLIRSLKSDGVTILLVEHDMDFVMGLVDRIVVLDFGSKLAEGLPAEIRANESVQEAYLGGVA